MIIKNWLKLFVLFCRFFGVGYLLFFTRGFTPGYILSKEGITYAYSTRPHAVSSTSDGKTYTYDANGNMINDTQRAILYNYDNMPTYVNYNGTTTQLVYDGQGNRVKNITGATNTIYIGTFYEVVNSGASCYKYIFAGGTRIARKNTSATHYYHQDHLGSSSVVTDSSGNNVEEIHYLSFGNAWSDTNAALTTHKFTGQELDAETGLYYCGARHYNPQLGRFISADTIVRTPGDPQDLNRYTYAGNNPLLYTDPTGHFKFSTFLKAVASGVAGGAAFYFSGGNPMVADMVAGAVSGAMTGKAKMSSLGLLPVAFLGHTAARHPAPLARTAHIVCSPQAWEWPITRAVWMGLLIWGKGCLGGILAIKQLHICKMRQGDMV